MAINPEDILIILPAFNEGSVIAFVIDEIKKQGFPTICVVDDGSTDNTGDVVKKLDVEVLTHPINRGAGSAIQTGICYARSKNYQYCVLIDSDGQHLPEDIKKLMDKMVTSQADLVIGNRFFKSVNDVPKRRLAYNKIANVLTNIFCAHKYSDTQSGFRLLNRKSIELIDLKNSGFGFCSEMIILAERLNLNIEETSIRVVYTPYSLKKGQNLIEGVRTARSILWNAIFE